MDHSTPWAKDLQLNLLRHGPEVLHECVECVSCLAVVSRCWNDEPWSKDEPRLRLHTTWTICRDCMGYPWAKGE